MRTTLTLDSDVAEQVLREIRRTKKTLKAVVNEGLRRGLGGGAPPKERFVVHADRMGLRAGHDPDRMNQLLDEMESAEAVRKLRRR